MPDMPNPFEDALLSPHLVTDMDGVLAPDWPGGSEAEEADPEGYLAHISGAAPIFIPPHPFLAVVTSRLHVYRGATEEWLARHGIRYGHLYMMPTATAGERRDYGNPGGATARDVEGGTLYGTARWKSEVYTYLPRHGDGGAYLFVESRQRYAHDIFRLTGRPVLWWGGMVLLKKR